MRAEFDFLVLGSGAAGLTFALKAAAVPGTRVAVLTKRQARESNTNYAQGGVASVTDSHDTFAAHIGDTLRAGAGLCREETVRAVVTEGPRRIHDLISWGVRFNRRGRKEYDLTQEGAHSARRVLHWADLTGHEIERVLLARAAENRNIRLFECHMGVNLIRSGGEVVGAYALDTCTGRVSTFLARATVLATGGSGKVYLYTSNPDVATGDGVAMAYRAGAEVANMEFVQFHPTCLFHPEAKSFLISESLRGEGGVLLDRRGRAFMRRFHPSREMAPRDVVARAIDQVLKESGDECVYLDVTHKKAAWLRRRFPGIYRNCLKFGVDITKKPIPVVPAAHYQCGGVFTDLDGKTSLKRLYAIGETACTGLHGANRLASNSLLEALVLAHRAAAHAGAFAPPLPAKLKVPPWKTFGARDSNEAVVVSQNWDEIRRLMWNYVGIVRTDKRLNRAWERIRLLQKEIQEYYWNFKLTGDLVELRNIATVAELIIQSARQRRESRGAHYTSDYPKRDDKNWKKDTVLVVK